MTRFSCPYLQGEVELTEEREQHIAERHPDLLPEYRERIAETLADPVGNARLFARWFDSIRGGKHVVVVVVSDVAPTHRRWVVTAYLSRKLAEGDVEWQRN